MKSRQLSYVLGVALVSASLVGCATNATVEKKIAESQAQTNQKIDSVQSQVETLQENQNKMQQDIQNISQEAKDALKRAEEAGVLAKGKVAFEQTLTDNDVHFKLGSDNLTDAAKKELDDFAAKVKALDSPYWVEIQGHTDSTGGARFNEMLGERRAEAVRRYLNQQQTVPLVRMSTISYGETMPAASNKTRDGRKQNRRVVLVVLQ
ncbi:MAG: OmpA family protein [Thermoanaerobaculia bacterium]